MSTQRCSRLLEATRHHCRLQSASAPTRHFTTSRHRQQNVHDEEERPRWQYTPKAMTMPIRLRERKQEIFEVNTKTAVLDQVYIKLLGVGGELMLPEEIKWLAVTHKSFDQGKRGSNDKLAFLGKRIVNLQSSLALLSMPTPHNATKTAHPALEGLDNISIQAKGTLLTKERLAQVAHQIGLQKVMRWQPKRVDNLRVSGLDTVLAHTLYSIIGALHLQRGEQQTLEVVQQKILAPLGLKR